MKQKLSTIHVVSHTHWDREWYQDFQGFRQRLVYLMDELLDVMENDPEYRYFMLDGQTILIEDYLEIRPENEERLTKLIRAGRIVVGPWYVMPDEFLVSGESLIRNLLVGFRRSRRYGSEPLLSGYVTDIFGHNSQLPQLLQGFGIDNAVLFRGFKGKDQAAELTWTGADRSKVLALRLDEDRSYGDFYFFIRWPFARQGFRYDEAKLLEKAAEMQAYKSARATTTVALGLDGVDHVEVEPELPGLLRTLNGFEEIGVSFVHSTLERYLEELRPKLGELETCMGEQRSPGERGLNNMVLANVLSSRIPLKQENDANEKRLERWAEPWSVFARLVGKAYPKRFLDKSWEYLLQNHPHDSICGCSIRQVHKDMEYRFDQSRLLSEAVILEQLTYLSNRIDGTGLTGDRLATLFNPDEFDRKGVNIFSFYLPGRQGEGASGPAVGGNGFRIYDDAGQEMEYQILDKETKVTRKWRPYRDIPYADQMDRYQVAVSTSIPSYGYRTLAVQSVVSNPPSAGEYTGDGLAVPVRNPGTMRIGTSTWDNGRVKVTVDSGGTLSIYDHATGEGFANLHRFEDDGDVGEGWNRVSPAVDAIYTSLGEKAEISIHADGPLVAILLVKLNLSVPVAAQRGDLRRASETTMLPIETFIEIRKDDPIVRFRTKVRNTARDHRLRLLFPTRRSAEVFYTSTPFDLVKRARRRPDYRSYMETASHVVPHNGIVAIHDQRAGLAILSKGLYEAEVSEDSEATASLTLFRSTGKEVLTDGDDSGQLLQELNFEYALYPYASSPSFDGALWRSWRLYSQDPRSIDRDLRSVIVENPFPIESPLPLSHRFLVIEAREGIQLSALKGAEDRPESTIVRLFNGTEEPGACTLRFSIPIQEAFRVDLDERRREAVQPVGGDLTVTLEAKKLETLELIF